RQGLGVRQNQGRPPESFDDLCHGKGLARPGDAQQYLVLLAVLDTLGQPFDGGGLVAARLEASAYLELRGVDERPTVGDVGVCELFVCFLCLLRHSGTEKTVPSRNEAAKPQVALGTPNLIEAGMEFRL